MTKYSYFAIGGLFIALCVVGWLLKNSYEENGRKDEIIVKLEAGFNEQKKLLDEKEKAEEEREKLLVEREKEITQLKKQDKEKLYAIEELRKNNQLFKDWGDELLPDDVIRVLEAD